MPNHNPNKSGLLYGANSNWKNQPTTTIRVPQKLSEKILEYAKRSDANDNADIGVTADTELIKTILKDALKLRANHGGAIKTEIKKVLSMLE
jgi:hypothetical protein